MKKVRRGALILGIILLSVILAIIGHAILPADLNSVELNSILVKEFGFPVVACLYFLVLYCHCSMSIFRYGKEASLNKWQIGVRFGLAFGLLYQVGMLEITPDLTSFTLEFVKHQFLIGLGDFLPVLILCVLLSLLLERKENNKKCLLPLEKKTVTVIVIAQAFFLERIVGYEIGIVASAYEACKWPCVFWNLVMGITFGVSYVLLLPIFQQYKNKAIHLMGVTIGLNWLWFNGFIVLVIEGTLGVMLIRGLLDVGVLVLVTFLLEKGYLRDELEL